MPQGSFSGFLDSRRVLKARSDLEHLALGFDDRLWVALYSGFLDFLFALQAQRDLGHLVTGMQWRL